MVVAVEHNLPIVIQRNVDRDLSIASGEPGLGVGVDPIIRAVARASHTERVASIDAVCHKRVRCALHKLGWQSWSVGVVGRCKLSARNTKGPRQLGWWRGRQQWGRGRGIVRPNSYGRLSQKEYHPQVLPEAHHCARRRTNPPVVHTGGGGGELSLITSAGDLPYDFNSGLHGAHAPPPPRAWGRRGAAFTGRVPASATDRSIAASTELAHAVDSGFVSSRFTGVNDAAARLRYTNYQLGK